MKRSPDKSDLLILGEGLVAVTLATVLNGALVNRQTNDAGWEWPRKRSAKFFSLILVAPPGASASQMVRWHGEAWRCSWIRDARIVIVCLDEPLNVELATRDVFGRPADSGESFATWRRNIAICEISVGLVGILRELAALSALPWDTWKGREAKASILAPLMRVLETENTADLRALVSKLRQQDWDAFCPHPHANRINRWLATVTEAVAPSWEEGKELFRPFAHPRE